MRTILEGWLPDPETYKGRYVKPYGSGGLIFERVSIYVKLKPNIYREFIVWKARGKHGK